MPSASAPATSVRGLSPTWATTRRRSTPSPMPSSAGANASGAGLNHPVSSLNAHASNAVEQPEAPEPLTQRGRRRQSHVAHDAEPQARRPQRREGTSRCPARAPAAPAPRPRGTPSTSRARSASSSDGTDAVGDEVHGVGGRVLAGVGDPPLLEPLPVRVERLGELVVGHMSVGLASSVAANRSICSRRIALPLPAAPATSVSQKSKVTARDRARHAPVSPRLVHLRPPRPAAAGSPSRRSRAAPRRVVSNRPSNTHARAAGLTQTLQRAPRARPRAPRAPPRARARRPPPRATRSR